MDFKRARKEAGMTLAQAAKAAEWAIGTISDLERTGKGSDRLRAKLTEIYGLRNVPGVRQYPEPEKVPPLESDIEAERDFWKRKAEAAHFTLSELKQVLDEVLRDEDSKKPKKRKKASSAATRPVDILRHLALSQVEKDRQNQPPTPAPATDPASPGAGRKIP